MKKNELLNFVSRYHLAGATTSVKWIAKDGKLKNNTKSTKLYKIFFRTL